MRVTYGWMIGGAGTVPTGIGFGNALSLGVCPAPMSIATGWSRAGTFRPPNGQTAPALA